GGRRPRRPRGRARGPRAAGGPWSAPPAAGARPGARPGPSNVGMHALSWRMGLSGRAHGGSPDAGQADTLSVRPRMHLTQVMEGPGHGRYRGAIGGGAPLRRLHRPLLTLQGNLP